MQQKTGIDSFADLKRFFNNFVLFHLGTDADVTFSRKTDGSLLCSIQHPRVSGIRFQLSPDDTERFALDIPSFEEYLLSLLTKHRRGAANED